MSILISSNQICYGWVFVVRSWMNEKVITPGSQVCKNFSKLAIRREGLAMRSAAFVTYNNVFDPRLDKCVETGWHEQDGRRALVLQSTKSGAFSEACMRLLSGLYTPEVIQATIETTGHRIDEIWSSLAGVVSTVDHVVVYLGVHGTVHAIEMARQLPIDKLVFLMCDCDVPWKQALLAEAGLQGARTIVVRECGGDLSMGRAFRDFLDIGTLPG